MGPVGDQDRGDAGGRDWVAWHDHYDEPGSGLAWRLEVIQDHIRAALDRAPEGPVRAVSLCAGQGRDLLGVLADHRRRHDVTARLVELDPRNTRIARDAAGAAGLAGVEVVTGDAGTTSAYAGAVPADLILACGVFGNVPEEDIATTVALLPRLAAPGATVIWTRHRVAPDLTPRIRTWFADGGFQELAFDTCPARVQGVGVHRLVADPQPFRAGERLFTFVGLDNLPGERP